jgi:integrase
MVRKRRSRIYLRGGRYGGDFRDLGGKREPLILEGERLATTDANIAGKLAADRVADLEKRKRNRVLLGIERQTTLAAFCAEHLERKADLSDVTDRWLAETEQRLQRAVAFFGADRDLASIGTRDVEDWIRHLGKTKRRGRALSKGTILHHVNALGNLYARALSDGCAVLNPVHALARESRPRPPRRDSAWLEIADAALYLESARTWKPVGNTVPNPAMYEVVATFLLSGGRESEVLGLAVEDISFDRGTVTFRPNERRRLKTPTSHRTVPLWPQLREILQRYIFEKGGPTSGLLFPSRRGKAAAKGDKMVHDTRKALDSIGERAGWKPGEIRSRIFRTTYATTRLQTLDNGAPVAVWTVSRELGHASTAMLERIYGKLGMVRHRSEVVEFRAEQHAEKLGDRLQALR